MKLFTKKSRAFTMVELLIVMGIIAAIAAFSFGSYQRSLAKARNAKRVSDVKAAQNGFEMYYARNGTYNTSTADCAGMKTTLYFPNGFPVSENSNYPYYTTCTSATNSYCICALLDTPSNLVNSMTNNCAPSGTEIPKTYYCLQNLQ